MALAQFEQQVFNAMNDMQLSVNSYNLVTGIRDLANPV